MKILALFLLILSSCVFAQDTSGEKFIVHTDDELSFVVENRVYSPAIEAEIVRYKAMYKEYRTVHRTPRESYAMKLVLVQKKIDIMRMMDHPNVDVLERRLQRMKIAFSRKYGIQVN